MATSAVATLDTRLLPSVPFIPGAAVPLCASIASDDILVFDVGPSTSLEPFPIPALDRHTLAVSTAGDYPVEARLEGEFLRSHVSAGGAGSLSIIPAGMPSEWRICTGIAFNTNLFLSHAFVARVALETFDVDPSRLAVRPSLFFEDRLLFELSLSIARICRGQGADNALCIDSLTQALAAHLLVQYRWLPARVAATRGRLSHTALNQVLEFIEEQPAADLRLARLASLANLSPYHFARLFQHSMGQPLHRYVLQRRLRRSCRLLLGTELSLAQVASDCGFADESHFLRRFKEAYGVTPSMLRKERKILR